MQDLNNKVNDGGATADGVLPAEQWNEVATELQNVIISTGAALSGGDLAQVGKAIANYVAYGDFYTVGGSANAITLTSTGVLYSITSYVNGDRVRFEAASNNTTGVTINVNGIGVVSLLAADGSALAADRIVAGQKYEACYDSTSSAFFLMVPFAKETLNGYLYGLTIANNGSDPTNDIDIATGVCSNFGGNVLMTLASTMTKRIDATWSAGTGNGGRASTVSLTNNTWYRVFIIGKADGTVDAGFDTSSTAANLLAGASGYIYYRQIGWIRYGTATIVKFFQYGDRFLFDVPIANYTDNDPAATTETKTVTVAPSTLGLFSVIVTNANAGSTVQTFIKLRSTEQTSAAASATNFDIQAYREAANTLSPNASQLSCPVDSSSQIKVSASSASNQNRYTLLSNGWVDTRGR